MTDTFDRYLQDLFISASARVSGLYDLEAMLMKLLRRAISLIGHEPIDGEFSGLALLEDAAFQTARAKHLSRRPTSTTTDNAGVVFVLSLIGTPICLVTGLVKHDGSLILSAVFWLVVGAALFFYLAFSAAYWREHRAIISEEFRRYGSASFG